MSPRRKDHRESAMSRLGKKKKGALEDSVKNIRKDIKRSVVGWTV